MRRRVAWPPQTTAAKIFFGRKSLWSDPAQPEGYPHRRAEPAGCPSLRDNPEAGVRTALSLSQVLDAKREKSGCPQRRAVLIYYDYL